MAADKPAGETRPPVLEIKGLTVSLPRGADREFAIEEVSLTVGSGEIVCVVGESGSGKSVTAFAVMGLNPRKEVKPVAGEILLHGIDLLKQSERQMRHLRGEKMAMIFQEPMTALNPVMKIGDQIAEMLEIHCALSAAERRDRVIAAMVDVNLPDAASIYHSYPHQISGGQRQRVMIAMALALDPGLLIADEPTTALDVTTQAQILELIKTIQKTHGTGVMFITHDFGVVAEIADRVVVMQQGRVVEEGTAEQILIRPEHPYTQMLINSVPSLIPPDHKPVSRTEPGLEARKLNKVYGTAGLLGTGRVVHAAKDVDLIVYRGETLGVVGESGSGKSTVARCIVRLVDPTSGELLISGQNIAELNQGALRPYRRDIQIVFQDPYRSLNPRRTVGQSIIEGPMNFGIGRDEALARAQELMRVVGLEPEVLDRFPHQFSGGQRQRICIARALAMEPKVLIADEAVSALDVSVQAQVLNLLDDVRERFDLAILFITHDLRVAAQICDRIMVMQNGVVVEEGRTHTVYSDPQDSYTKALLAAAPGRDTEFRRYP
ncbi:ABC transporter, ATP-binding protein (cluster 5, nickel/peptides/opines) / ABC transporter, ATP-binding protein (cluster 5, nickel/peptides/opines) [hydrothermal vent metagenome]|uniref:ABC transporter, ATP-binding protein (Cluster 5, nickel/peptides/opines) / ABC transporter, ATP-binding protein (Cluster 5, nickel/peptides/opines) n=1 Tax=hydrothermal vent metagenome TaxID=652676 RepID=A0A3B0TFH7_9ZZZZ